MTLFDQINEDLKAAMKAKESEKLMAIRAVKAQLLLVKTADGSSGEISEDESIKILQRMVKQRKDSAAIYKENGREELYDNEMKELSYIEAYLPKQLTEVELAEAVQTIITTVGATSVKDLGKVMGVASKQLAGKAEGKLIADKVKELLNK